MSPWATLRGFALALLCLPMLTVFACPAAATDAGEADEALSQLMQQLAARRHAHASFVERQTLAVLSRPVESSGELFYDAPDRLEKRTLKPKLETLILEQGQLRIQRGKRTYTLALRDAPQAAPFIDTIRATLAGDLPALQRNYALEFRVVGGDWTLQLMPRDAQLLRVVKRVRIDGSGAELREVNIDSADGDRSVMTIRELPGP
jgi:outer membrane lipoprotein-sorting protein